ncbi:hypothetical protein ZOSMA_62G00040 [Zostera marina]|uniref:Uncharacterized protein n=1 Tax=Zostera marina TaxID=29655 RepID=A0A0K9NT60_ZOSMR|nr:hypothetical protein ZOSMA_62G00040 [Zostera marina]
MAYHQRCRLSMASRRPTLPLWNPINKISGPPHYEDRDSAISDREMNKVRSLCIRVLFISESLSHSRFVILFHNEFQKMITN